ncbi:hypothetical protein PY093_20295 [Cytobacillus sp. S13-E01]|uniref:hypothetical protein n=1 Tax=Cytobacillus sp. S13-E01 TaxID=3031326 RepID=UPI0023D87C85|nr:hypothetical protein [Cytobacillus sp. S13-E01]MDF0728957.1 hypothetical protein [Cytobacillus sp. S13-E01]
MEKLDGKSLDLVEKNIGTLKRLFPEIVTEGKIDYVKLKNILGEEIDENKEKYEFIWHGKTKALKIAQTPSTGTLRPDKESSKNWDTTENIYPELFTKGDFRCFLDSTRKYFEIFPFKWINYFVF